MGFNRLAATACSQLALLVCGLGLTRALQLHLYASAAVLLLAALWIAAETAWRSRLQPAALAETPRRIAREVVQARTMANLLDQTPTPLVTLDDRGALRARNRAARDLFRTDDLVSPPPAALLAMMRAPIASGRQTARLGDRAYVVSRSCVQAANGPLTLAALLDIEADLRTAEARALRELMQVLSHEIMNGLTPVASLAVTAQDLLAEDGPDAGRQAREALAVLSRRAEGLARFAEGYRSLARLPPPQFMQTSLCGVLEEAAHLFRSQWTAAGVRLTAFPAQPDVEISIDRDQIMHALVNLLANAAEAALTAQVPPHVELTWVAQGRSVIISIADSGQGVCDTARPHVFQPFFTTKAQGSGVGLSLSRQIARAHGGELDLRLPEPGRGAVFDLRLEA